MEKGGEPRGSPPFWWLTSRALLDVLCLVLHVFGDLLCLALGILGGLFDLVLGVFGLVLGVASELGELVLGFFSFSLAASTTFSKPSSAFLADLPDS